MFNKFPGINNTKFSDAFYNPCSILPKKSTFYVKIIRITFSLENLFSYIKNIKGRYRKLFALEDKTAKISKKSFKVFCNKPQTNESKIL